MKEKSIVGTLIAFTLATTIAGSVATIPLLALQPQSIQAATNRVGGGDLTYSGPRASLAVSGKNIYLTWWDNKTGNNEVFFAGSSNGGKSFRNPINLSNATGGSADSQIAASDSNVYVAWWDNKTGSWEVFSRASTDNGKSFGNATMLKGIGNSTVKTLKAPPSNTISVDTLVAVSGNNEYITWWDNKTGNNEVFFARSTDNGKTFGNATNISNSTDLSSIGARIAASGDNVYIAWIDITNAGQKQVMFRASDDDGKTFGKPIMLNTTTAAAATVRGE
jgi:hypothetical protein